MSKSIIFETFTRFYTRIPVNLQSLPFKGGVHRLDGYWQSEFVNKKTQFYFVQADEDLSIIYIFDNKSKKNIKSNIYAKLGKKFEITKK